MEVLTVIFLALALSTDAFGAGVSYAPRQIAVPWSSRLVIALLSTAALAFSSLAGQALTRLIPPPWAARLGGLILLAMGLRLLLQGLKNAHHRGDQQRESTLLQIHVRSLGLVIQILCEPHRADLDCSGTISGWEAFLLGLALALDALACGLTIPLLDIHPALTALTVGLGQLTLFNFGLWAGRVLGVTALNRQFAALPGCLLIMLGLLKMR